MEEEEKKILEAIKADVRANADLVEERVNEETRAMQEDQIEFFRKGLEKENETYLEGELQDLRQYAATKSSTDRLNTKKQLLELRQQLVSELFDEVRSDLKKFTTTPAYEEYLRTNVRKLKTTPSGYFIVRVQDETLMKKILKEEGLTNSMKTEYMPIGGFQYVDKDARMEYTCMLKDRLADAQQWFREHSGFNLEESEEQA
ncbi:V-type ATP synthase subunit E family protein [Galactobacillus timonensis]|uniref:V-type ATP synthase subunit E family protein n=1 Tax=Galactobacillus timonensis TaxID=2041840 RepID=UPI000EC9EA48|nr:V-type ATP synthase subunit E family protein [Galactobacillus timonensis]MDD5851316.1 hypothetical protein [Galactobacillus timonensis]MDD6370117.1 hypothetical protein [Galactobacillus timonensis]MDY6281713.1 hypothetical protein [Erysipelotrichaceae bacterium]HCW55190.1 hypothetical protein [Erysipelotrichaceae bacterium]